MIKTAKKIPSLHTQAMYTKKIKKKIEAEALEKSRAT
jgi:hypothetical protein